jgi:hypothetical protein
MNTELISLRLLLRLLLLVVVVTCLAPQPTAAAGKYDGSVPLLCAPVVVTECGPEGDCRRRSAQSVNLPDFFKVDLKALTVRSEETGRDSPIKNVERLDGQIIMQGGQNGRGWTMTISEDTGKMSAAVSTEGEGFIVFGACALP